MPVGCLVTARGAVQFTLSKLCSVHRNDAAERRLPASVDAQSTGYPGSVSGNVPHRSVRMSLYYDSAFVDTLNSATLAGAGP